MRERDSLHSTRSLVFSDQREIMENGERDGQSDRWPATTSMHVQGDSHFREGKNSIEWRKRESEREVKEKKPNDLFE